MRKPSLQVIQVANLALLLAASPFVATFMPYDGLGTGNAGFDTVDRDPLYHLKAVVVIAGLAMGILGPALFVWSLISHGRKATTILLDVCVAILSFFLGWVMFPYWANGVYQAYSGNVSVESFAALDPEGLLPGFWIGGVWELGVVLFALTVFGGLPLAILTNIGAMIREHAWRPILGAATCLVLWIAIYLLSPGYGAWFFD